MSAKAAPKVSSSRFKGAEFMRHVWRVTPERGTTIEQLQKPEYWSHVAANLRPYARIEVVPEDGEYFAEFIVTQCDRLFAKVALICHIPLHEAAPVADAEFAEDDNADYQFKWKGPALKWVILRKADGEKVAEGFESKDAAKLGLKDYLKKAA